MFRLLNYSTTNLIDTLSILRKKALRKQVWFGALTTEERVLTGLIRNNVKIVKNATLATVVARIVIKLISAVRNSFLDKIERLGRPITESAAKGAYRMGWKEASKWVDDIEVVRLYGLAAYHSMRGGALR